MGDFFENEESGKFIATKLADIMQKWEYSVDEMSQILSLNKDLLQNIVDTKDVKINKNFLTHPIRNMGLLIVIDSILGLMFKEQLKRKEWFVTYHHVLKGVPEDIAKQSLEGLHKIKEFLSARNRYT